MCIDLRSLSLTVSAGEMAERVSSVDVGHVRNTRTDRQHGCVAANVSRFTMKVGGKPRSVWVQARPELVARISVGRVARYSSQQHRKSLVRAF